MAVRVGINGFGRIGRNFFRAALEQGADIEVVAVNDLGDAKTMAHLLEYDSNLGRLEGGAEAGEGVIRAAGKELKVLAEESRKQTGNLRFDVWQQVNRPNHFTVIEAWSNRGAFDLHQMQRPTKEFRGKHITMTGALYDERLYNALP